jgi:mannose-6-phosphate isomerase-like protein (cupin superfamily)
MFHTNIELDTLQNMYYRKTVFTNDIFQLVLMSLKPNENIPREVHTNGDQFIRIEYGQCKITTDNGTINLQKDGVVIIPAGTYHEVINDGNTDLKLYTLYSPPQHVSNLLQKNKPSEKCEELPDNQCGGNLKNKLEKYIKKCNKIMK